MTATARRLLRYLRLALVCLTLVWSTAPASAAPITDTIVLVAGAAPPPANRAAPQPRLALRTTAAPRATTAPAVLAPAAGFTPKTASRPRPPRRLYIEQCALLR
ncbi:Hypothetical protein A7982_10316 [Minicystis rosea]|nr:Hypothetical protein A7982_10316 [Minicystis rosea]